MTQKQSIKKVCQVLRRRVRFYGAVLRLPTTPFPDVDTPAIREATRLYVETWIVPLLDAIESGDTAEMNERTKHELGHEI